MIKPVSLVLRPKFEEHMYMHCVVFDGPLLIQVVLRGRAGSVWQDQRDPDRPPMGSRLGRTLRWQRNSPDTV